MMSLNLFKAVGERFEETKCVIRKLSEKQVNRRGAIKDVVIAGHHFRTILATELTKCALCKEFIWWNITAPIDSLRHEQCQLCKLTVHSQCAQRVNKVCCKSQDTKSATSNHEFKTGYFATDPFCDNCGTSIVLWKRLECKRHKCEMKVHDYCRDSICFDCPHKSRGSVKSVESQQNEEDRGSPAIGKCKSEDNMPKILDRLEILDSQLGVGSFSKIYLVRSKDTNNRGKKYAMKIVDKANLRVCNDPESSRLEWKILEMGRAYPFLAAGSCCFQTKTKLIYLLEHGPGGDLLYQLEMRGPFSEDRLRFYAAEIIMALTYLHKQNIVYRDLKPENVILDELGHCKLIDFGMAKKLVSCSTMKTNTFCGTQFYLSPELIQRQSYSFSIDWWALGVTMYELLFGNLPFYDDDDQRVYHLICNASIQFPSNLARNMSRDIIDLLERLLIKNPEFRLGCQIVEGSEQAVKMHPFFANARVPEQIVAQNFWQAIAARTYPPPIPALRAAIDTNNNSYDQAANWLNLENQIYLGNEDASADNEFDNFSQYGESFQDNLLI